MLTGTPLDEKDPKQSGFFRIKEDIWGGCSSLNGVESIIEIEKKMENFV